MQFSAVFDFAMSTTPSARRSLVFVVFDGLESLIATWCLRSFLSFGEAIVICGDG